MTCVVEGLSTRSVLSNVSKALTCAVYESSRPDRGVTTLRSMQMKPDRLVMDRNTY